MSHAEPLPDFDDPQLARAVERLSEQQINELPFGAVRLNAEGETVFYSETERRLSGYGDRPGVGRRFYAEIAPCMNTAADRGRVERALAAGALDLEFTHIDDFSDSERVLTMRVQSASAGGYWIFMRRDD